MNREQLRNELPEPVRRYFEEVARMEPPSDLLDAAVAQIETEPRVNRFSFMPAFVAVAATAVLAAVIAFGVFGLKIAPPTGNEPSPTTQGSPTPDASPTLPPVQTAPPLEGLPSAGVVEARYGVAYGGFPALAAHGSIWVSNGEIGRVTRLDPNTGEITAQIDVNPDPETTRYDQSLIADESFVWATGADETLVKIDPETNTVVERIDIGTLVYRMALLGDDIWITDLDSREQVLRFDTNTGELTFDRVMSGWPGGLAATDDSIWMTPYQVETLVRMDPASGDVLDQYTVGSYGMGILPYGDALFISGNQERPLERFSISEERVTARFGADIGVVLLDGTLYATQDGALIALDPETLQVTAALQISADAGGVLPGYGFLWVMDGVDVVKVRPG